MPVAEMSSLQQISIIIPFATSDMSWQQLLPDLKSLPANAEIILVAASEQAKQVALDFQSPVVLKIVCSKPGRAQQMNAGAQAAKNTCLWFLHADSRLDVDCLKAIDAFDHSKKQLGYFGLRFRDDGPRTMAINTFGVWFRSRFLKIPFGDQGFVISKSCFEMLGRFREDLSSGEDHALVWAARKNGVLLKAFDAHIETSARKYAQYGWGKTTRMHLRETWKQAREFSRQATR
ncbi:MAG: glycosyltransferase [Arenimonas sp.]